MGKRPREFVAEIRALMKTPGLKYIFEQIWTDEKKHDVILFTVPSMKTEKGGWIL